MILCRECDVLLLTTPPVCPSCGACRPEARSGLVLDPPWVGRLTVAALAALLPVLVMVDRLALLVLSQS